MFARSRLTLAAAVALLACLGALAAFAPDGAPPRAQARTVADDDRTARDDGRVQDPSRPPGQTSEGVEGETAPEIYGRSLGRTTISKEREWRIAPGIKVRTWKQTNARGPIRAHLVTADLDRAGVSLDYTSLSRVPDRAPLTRILRRDADPVAGVNGGFFDIYDTGAPLGVGRDVQRDLLHAALGTWDNAFWIADGGRPEIGRAVLQARIEEQPQLEITNVNSARVKIAGIGIYSRAWGTTSGYRITDGQTRGVRQVVIQEGRVVSNRSTLTAGQPITGHVLVGRGPGADALERLPVGSSANVAWQLAGTPRMAISGEKVLLKSRDILVTNDREMHPRTAVGIDRGENKVLLLVVDGRSSASRGYTMVELARMMRSLGAEHALNLDGGGSSTMVAEKPSGERELLNSPSDGRQRSVPDGIAVFHRP